jgi:hypothetical protein
MMPAYWGLGLATEAALASVRYGFADLGLKRIIGLVMPENIASVRVLKKTVCAMPRTYRFGASNFQSTLSLHKNSLRAVSDTPLVTGHMSLVTFSR